MTYREARMEAAVRLRRAGIKEDLSESILLLEAALRCVCPAAGDVPEEGVSDVRTFYLLHQSEEMPHRKLEAYLALTDRRCTRVPLQYLTGTCSFMGLPMEVNSSVLIPRQDTEILAEEALRTLCAELSGLAGQKDTEQAEERTYPDHKESKNKNNTNQGNRKRESESKGERKETPLRVLDLCTGSGCLAIALKAYCPGVSVTGSDTSAAALATAARNAAVNGQEVEWIESDLFAEISGEYDMIVSNPPYIPHHVIETLQPEVRFFEPRIALDGGEDGLVFYRKIASSAPAHLVPGGRILLEIGCEQGEAVCRLLAAHGFSDIKVLPDLAGLDRVVTGRREQYV